MVVLGRVTAPFGVRGWVRIHPFADDPGAWCAMPRWWLAEDIPAPRWIGFELRDCRQHGGGLVASLEGIDDRAAAEDLKGQLVAAPREELPATAENEYYWADLIGLAVVNDAGQTLGRVEDLIATGAHEVLVVRDVEDGRERLLPFVESVVREVDRAARLIRVCWQRDW
jgi:16S rRNA processing protein RimM